VTNLLAAYRRQKFTAPWDETGQRCILGRDPDAASSFSSATPGRISTDNRSLCEQYHYSHEFLAPFKRNPRAGVFIGRFIARRSITKVDNRNYTVHVINVVRKLRNDHLRSYHNNNTLIISWKKRLAVTLLRLLENMTSSSRNATIRMCKMHEIYDAGLNESVHER